LNSTYPDKFRSNLAYLLRFRKKFIKRFSALNVILTP